MSLATGDGVQTSTVYVWCEKKILGMKRGTFGGMDRRFAGFASLRLHLRAFTQGEGSISDCQGKLDFYTIFRCLAG